MSQMPQRKDLHIFCYHDLSLCSLYNTERIFFIYRFLPRLSTFADLAGHSVQTLADFIIVTLNFGVNLVTVNT